VKVTLALGSQSFQRDLAFALAYRGMLAQALCLGLDLEIVEPDAASGLTVVRRFPRYRLVNRILWAAWRRLPFSRLSRHFPVVLSTRYADRLMSHHISPSNIFHGWTGVSLACLRAAKRFNVFTIVENPSMHPRAWQQIVLEECNRLGIPPQACRAILPASLIRRMEAEFELCDSIIVPSAVARNSFTDHRCTDKAQMIHAGIDHVFFSPLDAPRSDTTFRVCYTGRIEIAKGVPYLLQAWKQLGLRNAELILIGEVAPEMAPFIDRYAATDVRFTGFQPAEQVRNWYRAADVFAFPSINEGLARVLLEAMATGLPVVATVASGAEDCVMPGRNGTIVPARDAGAMAEALLWHYQNRGASREMGAAARADIASHFTIAHYQERMLGFYQSLRWPETVSS
jgi:glycosyltransferase involved in cell wall biosynthesis